MKSAFLNVLSRKFSRKRKGFTLLECIIAIAVFSIMSMIVAQLLQMTVEAERRNYETTRDLNAQTQIISAGNIMSQIGLDYSGILQLPDSFIYHKSDLYGADDYNTSSGDELLDPIGERFSIVKKEEAGISDPDEDSDEILADGYEIRISNPTSGRARVYYTENYRRDSSDSSFGRYVGTNNEAPEAGNEEQQVISRVSYISLDTSDYEYMLIEENFINQKDGPGDASWTYDADGNYPNPKFPGHPNPDGGAGKPPKFTYFDLENRPFFSSLDGDVQSVGAANPNRLRFISSPSGNSFNVSVNSMYRHKITLDLYNINNTENEAYLVGFMLPGTYTSDSDGNLTGTHVVSAEVISAGAASASLKIRPLISKDGNVFIRLTNLPQLEKNHDSDGVGGVDTHVSLDDPAMNPDSKISVTFFTKDPIDPNDYTPNKSTVYNHVGKRVIE